MIENFSEQNHREYRVLYVGITGEKQLRCDRFLPNGLCDFCERNVSSHGPPTG